MNWLKQWRNSLAFSQQDMADALCVSIRTYRRYEAGDYPSWLPLLKSATDRAGGFWDKNGWWFHYDV